MSQKGRLRQTGGKGQRPAHGKMEETGSWGEQKKKKKRKAEARRKAEIICLYSLHHQDFGVHWNQYTKQRGESVLTYPKILVIESRRPPAGWESRLLKEGRTGLNLVSSFSTQRSINTNIFHSNKSLDRLPPLQTQPEDRKHQMQPSVQKSPVTTTQNAICESSFFNFPQPPPCELLVLDINSAMSTVSTNSIHALM